MHTAASPAAKTYLVPRLRNPALRGQRKVWGLLKGIRQKVKGRICVCVVCLGLLVLFGQEEPITEQVFTSVFGENGALLGSSGLLGSLTVLGVRGTAGSST